ncbi:MAG: hypothetical protein ACP5QO_09585 [Clostridia bacterium]
MSNRNDERDALQIVPTESDGPVELHRVQPTRAIRVVFWGLRIYITVMMALVIFGFMHGLH